MKNIKTISLLIGAMLVAAPVAYSGENHSMSDTQHRKTMAGGHHPEQSHDVDAHKNSAVMSDSQHRKTMSGMHHAKHEGDINKQLGDKKKAMMSDTQHRKSMGGPHHPDKD